MSDVDPSPTASDWPALLRVSQLGRSSVLAILASLVVAVACLCSGMAMAWPILVVGLGAAALASAVDVRQRRLLDVVVVPAAFAVVVLVVAGGTVEDSWARTWGCLGAASLTGVLFAMVCVIAPAQLGLGDAKLAVLLALTTAWLSPAATVWAFVAALVLAGLWAAAMLLRGKRGDTGLPLGPFLTLSAAASVFKVVAG